MFDSDDITILYYEKWKIFGIWFSVKVDHTPLQHLVLAVIGCLFHPLVPILFYLGKEYSEGAKPDWCTGLGKCVQGFGILDYGAILIIAIPWWIWLPSLL